MAVSDRNTLKNFFGTGQVPLAQHFADLVDSALNQQEDGIRKNSSSPLTITTGQADNLMRPGILFRSGEELAIHLPPVDGVDGSFSLQIPSDSPTDHLQVVFVGTASDNPRVTVVQGGIPNGGASPVLLDAADPSHLRIFISTNPTAIETIAELSNPITRGGFTVTRVGTATFNLQPSFPNGQWSLGLQDDVPGGTPLTGGLYIGNGDQQPLFIQNQTGFVGIGTNAPTEALEVNGALKVDGLDVKLTLDGLVTTISAASTGLVDKVGVLETTVSAASTGLVNKVGVLETTVSAASTGLVDKVGVLETTVSAASTGLVDKVGVLETTVSAASTGLVDKVGVLETTVSAASTGLVDKVGVLETTVSAASTGLVDKVGVLETTVSEASTGLVDKVGVLETTVSEASTGLVDKVGVLETTVSEASTGLVDKVGVLETTVSEASTGLVDKVGVLETTVSAASTGLVDKVGVLETTVGEASTGLVKDMADLKSALGTASDTIEIATLFGKIADLDTRLRALESLPDNP